MSAPVITGSPATELLAQVAADPLAPLRVAVVAPGGFGKTELLRELNEVWQRAGVTVTTPWQTAPATGELVLLADDAHRLDPAAIGALRAYAERPETRIVVACRPWPRPDGLSELVDLLRRTRPVIRLTVLSPGQIRDRLGASSPGQILEQPGAAVSAQVREQVGGASSELVAAVAELTGGVPRYVARVAEALTAADVAAGRMPVAALAGFAPELDELEPDVRTLLLAAEAGAGLSFDLVAALLGRDAGAVAELVDAGRATGLLAADGTLVPLARRAIAALGPIGHRIDVRQRLAALQLARGGPVLPLVRPLLRGGGADLGADGFDGEDSGARAGGLDGGLGTVDSMTGMSGSGLSMTGGGLGMTGSGLGMTGGGLGMTGSGLGMTGGGLGMAGSGLGPVYEAAGEEALGDDPRLAAELFAAAAGAGRGTAARRALATALAGDLDEASRLADQALGADTPEQRAEAAYVAAVVLTQRGQAAQAAALYRWSPSAVSAAFGVVALIGSGQGVGAATGQAGPGGGAAGPGDAPPTLLGSAAALMARGMAESIGGAPAAALSTLVQAATMIAPAGPAVLLADTPAALGATIALHCAELDTADALLARAAETGTGGALLADRHRLLRAWVLMLRGQVGGAQAMILGGCAGRDRLFAGALRVGLSREVGDLVGLRSAWPDACHALIGQPVDLFTLLPLGELTVAAARLGEQHRVAGHLAEADRLLGALGDPPLWSAPLHWSRLHAAVLAEDRTAAERHARALMGVRDFSPYTKTMATAAERWLDVLDGPAGPDAVIDAAHGLSALGLIGEGARLVGQAAIRTTDRKAMTLLLECARQLREQVAGPGPSAPPPGSPRLLSEREREVAALILSGLTYKQIAERLYLSAKTVEHHVSRIRQRLGVTGRPELLSRLRSLIDPEEER
ncbi:LuxR C-terminal-related transcriptional regulator [Actinoplanes sp. HUAS TT8]|uniref:helix-turn-helix transcriptional regulator n=1 Tax=Actinoplanes sp. HUAS TT8 TaxID=3447453 RepID=UPI003F51FE1D